MRFSIVGELLPVLIVGFVTGLSLIVEWPVFYLSGVLAGILFVRRAAFPALLFALWGAAYQLGSGLWLLPAAENWEMKSLGLAALCFGGFVFYGLGAVVLLIRTGWVILPVTTALAEFLAAQLGYSLAPIGLGAIDTPFAYFIQFGSIQYATAAILFTGLLVASSSTRQSVLTGMAVVGLLFVPGPNYPTQTNTRIAGISHNPDAYSKWHPSHAPSVLKKLKAATAKVGKVDLIVWPENAVTTTFDLDQAIEQIGPLTTPLLFGMNRYSNDGTQNIFNSAILLDGDTITVSDKVHLAPMMEGGLFPFVEAALLSGQRSKMAITNGETFLVLVCYEAAFSIPKPDLEEVDFIIVISADTGFWVPMARAIMERHAKARSMETGLPVLRVSDSAF